MHTLRPSPRIAAPETPAPSAFQTPARSSRRGSQTDHASTRHAPPIKSMAYPGHSADDLQEDEDEARAWIEAVTQLQKPDDESF